MVAVRTGGMRAVLGGGGESGEMGEGGHALHSGRVVATESGGCPGAGRWWVVAVRAD